MCKLNGLPKSIRFLHNTWFASNILLWFLDRDVGNGVPLVLDTILAFVLVCCCQGLIPATLVLPVGAKQLIGILVFI